MSAPQSLCECGHPYEAHRLRTTGAKLPSGHYALVIGCIATVTRRHEDGDDSWPCACQNFRAAKGA